MDKEELEPTYKLELYEVELITLYKILLNSKPRMNRVEQQIIKHFEEKSNFKRWKNIIDEIKENCK